MGDKTIMWTEITIDDIKLIEKAVNLSNSQFACFQSVGRVDSVEIIKYQLTKALYDYRGFLYEDGVFTIYLDFRKHPEDINWEVMRCWIQWDTLNISINPSEALQITGNKTKEFIQEVKTNVWMRALNYETAPLRMKEWFTPQLVSIYESLGIRVSYQKDNNMANMLFELI